MSIRFLKSLLLSVAAGTAALGISSCSMINDDLPPCEPKVFLRFIDNYNLLNADAFSSEVKSIAVWAFDKEGNAVWSATRVGAELSREGFYIPVDLPTGTYDFIAWGGLDAQDAFTLTGGNDIRTKDDLRLRLDTSPLSRASEPEAGRFSKRPLPLLFHGQLDDVEIVIDDSKPVDTTLRMPLVQDVHTFGVMLNNMKGQILDPDDFEVTLTTDNSLLDYNNDFIPSPAVRYINWNKEGIETQMPDGHGGMMPDAITAMLAELTTSRLFYGQKLILTVKNLKEQRVVLSTDVVSYLLAARGTKYKDMPPQEFLDRERDFNLLFFLDENNDWYMAAGIYINSWRVVPRQDTDFGDQGF